MKVCQIISDTNIGGGGRALLQYLEHCHRDQYQPTVILPKNSALIPRLEAMDIPYYPIDAMADRSYDKAAKAPLKALLQEIQPDLVHTHGSLVGRMVAKKESCQVLYTKHCAFPPTGLKATALGRFLVGRLDRAWADAVIAVGDSAKDALIQSGISASRIHVMYNGVSPLPIPSASQREVKRGEYGFSSGDFVLGILARVEVYKGHDTLLDAFALLLEKKLPVKLLIVGEGSHRSKLEERCGTFPTGSVQFTGFVEQVEEVLGLMDVQVNASYESETSSLSLLEGMSMGVPALASDCGGNPYLIRHEKNGLIFPAQDAPALAAGVERLWRGKALYQSLKKQAQEIFAQEFTAEKYSQHMEEIYAGFAGKE